MLPNASEFGEVMLSPLLQCRNERSAPFGAYPPAVDTHSMQSMPKTSQERAAVKARLSEIHAELRVIESKIDLDAWKKLFNEKIRLDRRLQGAAEQWLPASEQDPAGKLRK